MALAVLASSVWTSFRTGHFCAVCPVWGWVLHVIAGCGLPQSNRSQFSATPALTQSDGASGWETIFENEALLERAVELEGSWQLSLTGRPEIAARALIGRENPRTSYWGGSCSKPIRIMSRRGGMLPREWESMTGDASKPTPPPTPQK